MVEFIKFKGKEYPVMLGIYSLRKFQQKFGYSVQDATNNIEIYEELLWLALENGAAYMEQEVQLKREQMGVVLDGCMLEFIELFPKFLDIPMDELVEKAQEVGGQQEKKKSPRRPTSASSAPRQ